MVLLWPVGTDTYRWQIILPQGKHLSCYLPFPMGYRQTVWLVLPRWLRMSELNQILSHRAFVSLEKMLWVGENSIFSDACTHSCWVALGHTYDFFEQEQTLDVRVMFKAAFQPSICATNSAVQWRKALLLATGWHYSCFIVSVTGAKVNGRGVPASHLAHGSDRPGKGLILLSKCSLASQITR